MNRGVEMSSQSSPQGTSFEKPNEKEVILLEMLPLLLLVLSIFMFQLNVDSIFRKLNEVKYKFKSD